MSRKPSASAISALKVRLQTQRAAEQARILADADAHRRAEEERLAQEQQARDEAARAQARIDARATKRQEQRAAGTLLSPTAKDKQDKNRAYVAWLQSQSTASNGSFSVVSDHSTLNNNKTAPSDAPPQFDVRAPVCCILAQVNSGKTSFLDCVRGTRVQHGEAGGITQQMGAGFVAHERIQHWIADGKTPMTTPTFPGVWFLDTPGHTIFHSFRERGSQMCDVALVMINLLHGVETTTHESIRMLLSRNVPFVLLLNKCDKLYGWKTAKDTNNTEAFAGRLSVQGENTRDEFDRRVQQIIRELAQEHQLSCSLHWQHETIRGDVDSESTRLLVPLSAKSGEGVGDVFRVVDRLVRQTVSLRQALLIMQNETELEAHVLESRVLPGIGPAIDVLVKRGKLHKMDLLAVADCDGTPLLIQPRMLYVSPETSDLRQARADQLIVRESVSATECCKLACTDADRVMVGSRVLLLPSKASFDEAILRPQLVPYQEETLSSKLEAVGVVAHASTLGALDALLEMLKDSGVPVSSAHIGPVFRTTLLRASIQTDERRMVVCFGIEAVSREVMAQAKELDVTVIQGDIVYDVCERAKQHFASAKEARRASASGIAVFPVVLEILPGCIFNKKQPIVLGVRVREGILKVGTPLCTVVVSKGGTPLVIGRVTRILLKDVEQSTCVAGSQVSIQITADEGRPHMVVGRQFDSKDVLYSCLSRESIDALKQHYKSDLSEQDWRLVVKLKQLLGIV